MPSYQGLRDDPPMLEIAARQGSADPIGVFPVANKGAVCFK